MQTFDYNGVTYPTIFIALMNCMRPAYRYHIVLYLDWLDIVRMTNSCRLAYELILS